MVRESLAAGQHCLLRGRDLPVPQAIVTGDQFFGSIQTPS